MFSKLFKSEGGFTLVELLVTIAILGVLFGIVTLTLSGVGANAEDSVKIAECAVVQSAADIWLAVTPPTPIVARRVGRMLMLIDAGDVVSLMPTSVICQQRIRTIGPPPAMLPAEP